MNPKEFLNNTSAHYILSSTTIQRMVTPFKFSITHSLNIKFYMFQQCFTEKN